MALQKRRFCKVKAAVLQRKTYAFGKPKKNTRFSVKIFRGRGKAKWVVRIVRFRVADTAIQGNVGADSSRSYAEDDAFLGGYRFAAFGVRNAINLAPALSAAPCPCTFLFPANFGCGFFSSFIDHN
ncbi:MAG: hypothetical protein ACTTJN_05655 [Prevotella intermedia]